jgi:hypothetical protein
MNQPSAEKRRRSATPDGSSWSAIAAVVVVAFVLCAPAFAADKFAVMRREADGSVMLHEESERDWVSAQAGAIEHYDNWRAAVSNPPGHMEVRGDIRMGGHEFGDHMVLSNYQESIVDSLGHSYSNNAPAGQLTRYEVIWRWYNADDMSLLGSYQVRVGLGFPFPPGDRARVRQDEGFLLHLDIPLAPRIFFSTQYVSAEGISHEDIGILYGRPINTGMSPLPARDFTTGAEFDPGGDSSNNLVNYMKGYPIPAPSIVAFGGAVFVVNCGRRRSAGRTRSGPAQGRILRGI